jgi:hypothetical protein
MLISEVRSMAEEVGWKACLLLCFLLLSCQQVTTDDVEVSDPDGSLIVSIQDSLPPCTRINYAFYTLAGTRVRQASQQAGTSGFGRVAFQLQPDTYQLVVVAHSSNGNPTMTNPHKIQFTNAKGFTDTFLYYCPEVLVTGEELLLTVPLSRIVSLCRVVFSDSIPQDVATLQFTYTGGSGAFDASTGLGCVRSTQKMEFPVIPGQREYDLYTFLHSTEGTLHLQVAAQDKQGHLLRQCTYDVPMAQHQITGLTTPFSGAAPTDITIRLHPDWQNGPTIPF